MSAKNFKISEWKVLINYWIEKSGTDENYLDFECISTGKLSCDVIIRVPNNLL